MAIPVADQRHTTVEKIKRTVVRDVSMTLTIRPLPEVLGAEITGIDLGQPLAEAGFAAIRSALEDRQVLMFRDQHITPEQHIDFSRRFGPLEIHVQHHFHLVVHPLNQ
jgi:taurine dioxygenase